MLRLFQATFVVIVCGIMMIAAPGSTLGQCCGGVVTTLAPPPYVAAQPYIAAQPIVVAQPVVAPQPIVTYVPQVRGFLFPRVTYRPVVSYPMASVSPVTTACYAPPAAPVVTSFYVPLASARHVSPVHGY